MQIATISHTLTGYLIITIEGYSIEKLINQARRKGIFLWDLDRKRNTILKAKIGIRDFKRIRKIARKTRCGIQIEEKKGLPFFLRKYRKRKIFVVFLGLVSLGILLLSQFVWNVEVDGNEEISTEEILQLAKECGIDQGTWKGKIDTHAFTNRMRLEKDELAWVGVELQGTNITIKVVEAEKKPEMIAADEYCQIVATKEGAIQRIQAQNGTIQVTVGDLVKPGDVLISGTMEGKYTGVRNVHAIRRSLGTNLVYQKRILSI